MKNLSKINQNGGPERFMEGLGNRSIPGPCWGGSRGSPSSIFGSHLATIFDEKSEKWLQEIPNGATNLKKGIQKWMLKKGCRKGSEKYAKRLQNDAKMDAKIIDFHVFSKKAKSLETICFTI